MKTNLEDFTQWVDVFFLTEFGRLLPGVLACRRALDESIPDEIGISLVMNKKELNNENARRIIARQCGDAAAMSVARIISGTVDVEIHPVDFKIIVKLKGRDKYTLILPVAAGLKKIT